MPPSGQTIFERSVTFFQCNFRFYYVPNQSRDHADSEYVSHEGVDRKGAEFIGNKQIHSHTDFMY